MSTLRTRQNVRMYSIAAETLPIDLARLTLLDARGRPDMVGHILLCAGWTREDLAGEQVAPEWLWKTNGAPTKEAVKRLGLARPDVLVVEELLRLADLGTWQEMHRTLRRLAAMPLDAEFRVRVDIG